MNKYQDALDDLWNGCPNPKEQVESKEILQELVDKETPRKVKPCPELNKWFNSARCPKCQHVVEIDEIYCPKCGQRLDWSEHIEESENNAKD